MSNAPGDYVKKRKLPNLFGICAFLSQETVIQLSDISSLYQEWDFQSSSNHPLTLTSCCLLFCFKIFLSETRTYEK